jgi:hypothetical protein
MKSSINNIQDMENARNYALYFYFIKINFIYI